LNRERVKKDQNSIPDHYGNQGIIRFWAFQEEDASLGSTTLDRSIGPWMLKRLDHKFIREVSHGHQIPQFVEFVIYCDDADRVGGLWKRWEQRGGESHGCLLNSGERKPRWNDDPGSKQIHIS
jgi:hypothetical protein